MLDNAETRGRAAGIVVHVGRRRVGRVRVADRGLPHWSKKSKPAALANNGSASAWLPVPVEKIVLEVES